MIKLPSLARGGNATKGKRGAAGVLWGRALRLIDGAHYRGASRAALAVLGKHSGIIPERTPHEGEVLRHLKCGSLRLATGMQWTGVESPSQPRRGRHDVKEQVKAESTGHELCIVRAVPMASGQALEFCEQVGTAAERDGYSVRQTSLAAHLVGRWVGDGTLRRTVGGGVRESQVLIITQIGERHWYILGFGEGWIDISTDICVDNVKMATDIGDRLIPKSAVVLVPSEFAPRYGRNVTGEFRAAQWMPGPLGEHIEYIDRLKDPLLRRRAMIASAIVVSAMLGTAGWEISRSTYIENLQKEVREQTQRARRAAEEAEAEAKRLAELARRENVPIPPWAVSTGVLAPAELVRTCATALSAVPWEISVSDQVRAQVREGTMKLSLGRTGFGAYHVERMQCNGEGLRIDRVSTTTSAGSLGKGTSESRRWGNELLESRTTNIPALALEGTSLDTNSAKYLVRQRTANDREGLMANRQRTQRVRAQGDTTASDAQVFAPVLNALSEGTLAITEGRASLLPGRMDVGVSQTTGRLVWATRKFSLEMKDRPDLKEMMKLWENIPGLVVERMEWEGWTWRISGYAAGATALLEEAQGGEWRVRVAASNASDEPAAEDEQ